jgi:exopolyphosphatase / guanosine-5'-triphosphate,3'-diphosphate pyrophosphatase
MPPVTRPERATRPVLAPKSGASRVAVIDIGSNSIRLVVFEGVTRAPIQLFNEKVYCALGKTVGQTGRLNPDGVAQALASLTRFSRLLQGMEVVEMHVVATAAVRDATDGPDFLKLLKAQAGLDVVMIGGDEEGRLSAQGVLSGTPDANGIMADMGGGSVELVRLEKGHVGQRVSRPLGPFRLMPITGGRDAVRKAIDLQIADLSWLKEAKGEDFYVVGGAFRAFAKVHMEQVHHPLHIIHHYAIEAKQAVDFAQLLSKQSRSSLEQATTISRRRAEALPYAALVLERLLKAIEPKRLVFSAFGLREGILYDRLPEAQRPVDPLLDACMEMADRSSRFGEPDALIDWTRAVWPEDLPPQRARLYHAACLLSDIAWLEHPDYRALHAYLRTLRLPFGGLDHFGRAFLALTLYVRYGGKPDDPMVVAAHQLLPDSARVQAAVLGNALRLALTLTGGTPRLLDGTALRLNKKTLVLELAGDSANLVAEAVTRRLEALAKLLDRAAEIVRIG